MVPVPEGPTVGKLKKNEESQRDGITLNRQHKDVSNCKGKPGHSKNLRRSFEMEELIISIRFDSDLVEDVSCGVHSFEIVIFHIDRGDDNITSGERQCQSLGGQNYIDI